MNCIQTHHVNDNVSYSCFSTSNGCEELYLTIRTTQGCDIATALDALSADYEVAICAANLKDTTTVFSRLFLSDMINQKEIIETSPLMKQLRHGALSLIEQKPVGGGPISLFSYHVRGVDTKSKYNSGSYKNTSTCKGNHYSLLYTANFSDETSFDVSLQTSTIFNELSGIFETNGIKLLDNTIRTWIYVHDVDNHYMGMVRARKEFFTEHGLTNQTRYLASTGIDGGCESPGRLVCIDSLSIGGLIPEQIIRMEAPTHLSPTIMYGVTFERGLRVKFGDRSHLYISGTASIDNKGNVLFIGDIVNQTRQTVENLIALLDQQQSTIADLAYLIVYVRNFHEWGLAHNILREKLGHKLPIISVEAKVCRPTWLIELEGVAVMNDKNDFPPYL